MVMVTEIFAICTCSLVLFIGYEVLICKNEHDLKLHKLMSVGVRTRAIKIVNI